MMFHSRFRCHKSHNLLMTRALGDESPLVVFSSHKEICDAGVLFVCAEMLRVHHEECRVM
jgi:hypothetical protein